MRYSMSHILVVFTQQCGGLEPQYTHGHFLAHQLQEAIECAKAHIEDHEATLVQVVPLGEYNPSQVVTVWAHEPKTCTCKVCVDGRPDPLYRHDCDTCTFVGCTHDEHGRPCDLYVHEANGEYIARFSSEGSDYIAHDADIVRQFPDRPTHTAKVRYEARKADAAAYEASLSN